MRILDSNCYEEILDRLDPGVGFGLSQPEYLIMCFIT